MSALLHINENRVLQLLDWDKVFHVIEGALESVASNHVIQSARSVIDLKETNFMFVMPGKLRDDNGETLGCKIACHFPGNTTLPPLMANILLMDALTGELQAVIAATGITAWRTAAASAVATKYLHNENNKILAIIGAGAQGRIHAICLSYFFKFKEVRVWNRNRERAVRLVTELSNDSKWKCSFKACETVQSCLSDADVVVTTTGTDVSIVKLDWLKPSAHINAVGVGLDCREIDDEVYKAANVYIDHWDGAKEELKHLIDIGIQFKGQIGDLIRGSIKPPPKNSLTIFQSLGMAVEDCAVARMIYDLHMQNK
ncbi:hypothetical protein PPYR_12731 [Photinus pyralis]|uniref:Ketimine reductase mu-crystallin n=1 Tax=Photinus pyralis TaxID=7054 RepID=A0A5N4A715_PHOPY|nr:ketimine reductase mu-crystallin-like isoform X1 [Photinus pyralis]KAB0793111.1 hypothetical protein PPYR_12731 [Photinus pyralis]